ncbi:MAG: hypothetical protein ACLFU0_12040 [Alphaproteobacteria bacterium]
MGDAVEKLVASTDDPVVLLLIIALVALGGVCLVLFRAWCAEIRAHRATIQDNIQWTRQNTLMISEVRHATERFAALMEQAGQSWERRRP